MNTPKSIILYHIIICFFVLFVITQLGLASYALAQEPSSSGPEELEASGAIPKLERSNILAGIDEDNNGVRDDIDAFIQSNYTTDPRRAAAVQAAKAMQKISIG